MPFPTIQGINWKGKAAVVDSLLLLRQPSLYSNIPSLKAIWDTKY